MIPEVENSYPEPPKPNSRGWFYGEYNTTFLPTDDTQKRRGPFVDTAWCKVDAETGTSEIKDFGKSRFFCITRTKFWISKEEQEWTQECHKQAYLEFKPNKASDLNDFQNRYQQLMSLKRAQKRHTKKVDNEEVQQGTPRLEFYLKKAVETYGQHLNFNITNHLAAGNTLPYHHIQIEYNIMKGFVPLAAMAAETSPEDIAKLRVIENEKKEKGVEAAYIRMDKILHLTDETLARKQEELKAGVKQNYLLDLETKTARVVLYQAMAPLSSDVNFQKGRYRLIEDLLFSLTTSGLEYQEVKNAEEARHRQLMQREDVQNKVKEVEEMFTVTKGGNENPEAETQSANLKVAKEEAAG